MEENTKEKQKVVIIGGGFAGSKIARRLEKEKNINLTLIDSKDYYEFTPSVLRTIVEPEHMSKIQVLYSHFLTKSEIVKGEIDKIDKNYVYFKQIKMGDDINKNRKKKNESKEKIAYDYLIITSGSSYVSPFKEKGIILPYRAQHLVECHKCLEEAKKILIVGGGLVGVELASEIATHYPINKENGKDITLVHSGDRLIPRNNVSSSKYAEKWLKKRGVHIIYNERVKNAKKTECVTDKGRKIKYDMIFYCTGTSVNSDFMKSSFKDKLDEKRKIRVNRDLRVEGEEKIYAAGDVTSIVEEKLAQNAENQANIVIKNILKSVNGKEGNKIKLVEYVAKKRLIVMSLGRHCGVLEYKSFVLTGFIPGLMKRIIEWKTMMRYS